MFKTNRSHQQFQDFLGKKLFILGMFCYCLKKILHFADAVFKVFFTDLTAVRKILYDTYNPRGETPWDPVCLFRSYWLMCQYGNGGSITDWVDKLKSEPFWAVLSGFTPDDVPGVGTFYDFEDRLCDFDNGQRVERTKKMRDTKSKPKKKYKKNQKQPPKHKGIVKRLVARIRRDEDKPQPQWPDDNLNLILKTCFVLKSAQMGILGNPGKMYVSGDGMVIVTGASPYATKECDCHKEGNYNCDCPGRYSDPSATWGWDSYREKYVYGYTNYTFTAANSPYDLPLFSTFVQASRHDSVTHTYALFRMRTLYPEFNFSVDILDSAHDNYATYELLKYWGIEPFIDLNETNTGNYQYTDCEIKINEDGVPVCKCGRKMSYWGADYERRRHKWRCPHVVCKSVNCPYYDRPEDDYGRTYYTKFEDDIRLFTETVRGSKKWKETMKKRSSSERRNSRVKEDYNLENDKVRSQSRWAIRTIMRDCAMHTDAWIKESEIDPKEWVKSWFNIEQAA